MCLISRPLETALICGGASICHFEYCYVQNMKGNLIYMRRNTKKMLPATYKLPREHLVGIYGGSDKTDGTREQPVLKLPH